MVLQLLPRPFFAFSAPQSSSILFSISKRAILAACSLIAVVLPSVSTAQRIPSDFNQDGVSDLVLIETNRTLLWTPLSPAGISVAASQTLGVTGDHVILADWLGLGRPQLGVTRVERGSNVIVWRIKDDAGLIREFQFGVAGDTVVAAPDFNGNGIADAAIIRRSGRKTVWIVALDPFTGGNTLVERPFGTKDDSFFFIHGSSAAAKIVARSNARNVSRIRTLDILTGDSTVVKNLALEKSKAKLRDTFTLRNPEGKEMIATVRTNRNKTVISLVSPLRLKKKTVVKPVMIVKATGDTVFGNFLPEPGFEIAIRNGNDIVIVNPFNKSTSTVQAPSGVLVDELNINRIGKPTSAAPVPSTKTPVPSPPPSPGEPAPVSLSEVCSSVSDVLPGELLIKSEISNHIHNIDPRATGYTLVCAARCPSSTNYVPFYYSDGSLAGAVGYYGVFSGNGRPRLYGAAAQAPQHFVSEIAPRAAAIGDGKLYMSMGNGTCKRFNPTGRNGSL